VCKRAKVVFECQNTNDCFEEKSYNVISSAHDIININRVNLMIMIIIIIITSNNPLHIYYIENSFMKKNCITNHNENVTRPVGRVKGFFLAWRLLRVLFDRKYILTNVDSMEYYFHTQIINLKCWLPFIAKPKWWNHHQMVIINNEMRQR